METKKCPYCAEEIKLEALKCKHCGEFINSEESTSTVPPTEEQAQAIIPQEFLKAIGVGVLAIILDFAVYFNNYPAEASYMDFLGRISIYISMGSIGASIYLWMHFHDYLKNFKSEKAITWFNWYFALIAIIKFLIFIINFKGLSEELVNVLGIFFLVLLVLNVTISVVLGIIIQKIKNDFIGLLREFGMSLSYLIPVVILFGIIGVFGENQGFYIVALSLYEIPTALMIMIFWRAYRLEK